MTPDWISVNRTNLHQRVHLVTQRIIIRQKHTIERYGLHFLSRMLIHIQNILFIPCTSTVPHKSTNIKNKPVSTSLATLEVTIFILSQSCNKMASSPVSANRISKCPFSGNHVSSRSWYFTVLSESEIHKVFSAFVQYFIISFVTCIRESIKVNGLLIEDT